MINLKFYFLLAVFSLVTIIIVIILWFLIGGIFKGFDDKANGKSKGWPFIILIPLFMAITPATVFFYQYFNFKIPQTPIEIKTYLNENTEELKNLSEQMSIVTMALKSPKDLTLKQIESILSNSLDYSQKVNLILNRNDSLIRQLKAEVEIEKKSAEESKRIAENIKSITKDQLEAIKLIITLDAKEASKESFIYGILVSIPIGFLMSLLASSVYRKWGTSAKKKIEKKLDHNKDSIFNYYNKKV
jgi:hypothetical protein